MAFSLSQAPGRRRLAGPTIIYLAVSLVAPALAFGQLSIPTSGVLPSTPVDRSLILGDQLLTLRSQWLAPVSAHQQHWINAVNSRANQSTNGGVPATFPAAATDSSVAQSAGLRFAMTGNTADLNKAVGALLSAALPPQNSNDFITHPELLTSYLSAYDYIRGATIADLSAATRTAIESRLTGLAQGLSYGNNTASNALGKIGATKALAGVLFQSQSLLNTGLTNLQTHYNYSTTNDGWFTDSQSLYLDYTVRHLALFVRAYEQGSGVDLYDNVQPLLDMSIGLRKPDGTVPNVSNGLNWPVALHLFSHSSNTAAASQMLWNLDSLPVTAFDATNIQNNDYSSASLFALTDFTAAPAPPTRSPTFLTNGQSSVSVFRNDWSSTSDYLLMSPGVDSPFITLGGGVALLPAFHSHNDTAEILVASGGQYLLVAAGYNRSDLSNYPAGFASQHPTNHNVILVDGDLGLLNEGRTMRPERFVHTDRLDSTEHGGFRGVGDFATLEMEYGGAQVARSSGLANDDYFVVADRMQSATSHAYGFNLIGRGTQTVLTNTSDLMEVKWEHGGQQVIEHLVSTHPMTLTTAGTYMHDEFNLWEATRRMTATTQASDAVFLSVMETGPAGSPSQLTIADLSTSDYAALRATNVLGNFEDWLLSQLDNTPRDVGPLGTDAEYGYLRHIAGRLDSAMIARGTQLSDDGVPIFAASELVTMSLLFGDDTIRGTISADVFTPGTELRFFEKFITSATLNGDAITFFNEPGYGGLYLPSAGSLVVEFQAVPEPSSLALLTVGLVCGACWHRGRRTPWQ